MFLIGFYRSFLSPVRPRMNGAGNGEALELPITPVAKQIVAKERLRKDRGRPVTASDTAASTLWTSL